MKSQLSANPLLVLFGAIVIGLMMLGTVAQSTSTSSLNTSSWAYTTSGNMPDGMTSGAWDVANTALDIAQHLTGPMLDHFDNVAQVALGISPQANGVLTNANGTVTSSQVTNTNGTTTGTQLLNPNNINTGEGVQPANSNTTTGTQLLNPNNINTGNQVTNTNNTTMGAQGTNTNNTIMSDQQILQKAKAYWDTKCGGVCPIPFQCGMFVETAYAAAGHPLPQTYNAFDYWQGYQNQPGWQEIPVKTSPPMVGDLVVWGGGEISANYPNGIGHIAIVVAVQLPSGNTNGSVTVAQANTATTAPGNFTTPSQQLAPSITKSGIRLYQMPLLPDYSVQTWEPLPGEKPFYVVGYIRNLSLIKNIQSINTGSASNSKYVVAGSPTITADSINKILQANNSPAAGQGQEIYDLGVQYNIDPVYALAFFKQESSFGTQGVARMTLSPGNERCVQDLPCVDMQGNVICTPAPGQSCARFNGYAKMASWGDGFEQWYQLISSTYTGKGLNTVDQIIPVYAPASDNNNVSQYVQAVEQSVDKWRSGQLQ